MNDSKRLRDIPSVTEILTELDSQEWGTSFSHELMVESIREELRQLRQRLKTGDPYVPEIKDICNNVRTRLEKWTGPSLKRVVNATGIIVHTNLGRAPLAAEAVQHLATVATGYSNLELDLTSGKRGSRDHHLEPVFHRLLGVESLLVVNNNAAALLLILNTFAEGREVIVSRGELIEIGGSFRLPEIMKKSGAILREVGTTNKTRLQDYRQAISSNTAMILVAHPSNFQIVGFTEKPELKEIVDLGKEHQIMVVEDHGSGIFTDLKQYGISGEPWIGERLKEGPDLICFSGDKILGGPQSGIICGKKDAIQELKRNQLFRALRVDKMTYAALEATLLLYMKGEETKIPVIFMLSQTVEQLQSRANNWISRLGQTLSGCQLEIVPTTTYVGGGVAPMKGLPSVAVSLVPEQMTVVDLAGLLRENDPPVIARTEGDRLLFELRTLTEEDLSVITEALKRILP